MGFFDTLRRVLAGEASGATPGVVYDKDGRLIPEGVATTTLSQSESTSKYDRAQWHKKLKRILDELPDSRGEWPELMSEAKALDFDPDWLANAQREEFLLQIRRVVSDRVVTEAEHRKLDLCRDLIGLSDEEAEAALHDIMAEAESFFGKPVTEA